MGRIGWTASPVDTANPNRDGTGVLVQVLRVESGGLYVDTIACRSLGTNVATEAVILANDGQGLACAERCYLLGNKALDATTLGTALATDEVSFRVRAWFDAGHIIYALVHDNQAAGRSFIAYTGVEYGAIEYALRTE